MDKKLISIVMPAFNAEKWIKAAIESIQKQTYSNWELIIVNDGSTDNTQGVCEAYCKKDKRISVIKQKNKGVCSARNCGMQQIKGEFFIIIDSDDVLLENAIETYVDIAIKDDCDIVICGYIYNFNGIKTIRTVDKAISFIPNGSVNTEEVGMLADRAMLAPPWNKLYKKKFSDLRYDTLLSINEDLLFSLEAIKNAKRVTVIEESLYEYIIQNELSLSKIFHSEFPETLDKVLMVIIGNKYSDIKKEIATWLLDLWFVYVKNICKNSDFSVKEKRKYIRLAMNCNVYRIYGKNQYVKSFARKLALKLLNNGCIELYIICSNMR